MDLFHTFHWRDTRESICLDFVTYIVQGNVSDWDDLQGGLFLYFLIIYSLPLL